ncbi:MAG TPA: 2-octaprenyl-3-methyl-6-methoxy-1,4-benzoquinol hydroxylase [Porticoccaceae bacterium]|nr:2-octaprenyl-3-methyl-6-methoxy-1,4-benzoquinol hydroxylase [Porticoccaceae bacterium]
MADKLGGEQSESSRECFDVVIAGAGIVGSALALALASLEAERPLRIALVEPRAPEPWSPDIFGRRVVALNESSRLLLEEIGVWPSVIERRACPYKKMKVRDREGIGAIDFDCAESGLSELGYIVESALIVDSLSTAIADNSAVTRYQPNEIVDIDESRSDRIGVELSDRCLTASLLVAADGARSPTRALCGFKVREWDYGHSAIVATVSGEKPHDFTAWQWFSPAGPLAFLPLRGADGDCHSVSIVWSQKTAQSEMLMADSDEAFCRALGIASEHVLGDIRQVSARAVFPLRQCHATDYVKSSVALVGDAAHTIHPLAGLGVNLGLSDVQTLAEEIGQAPTTGEIGSKFLLHRYQRRRKPENLAVMAAMEGFKRLFEREELPLKWLRNFGMRQVDGLAPLKQLIVRQATGGHSH